MLEKDSFMNVKPGDKFVKEVTIKNGSGIDTDLAISGGDVKSGTELDKAIKDGFIKVDNNINEVIEDLNNNDNHDPWGTNEEKTATLKIVVEIQSRVPDQDNNYNSNGGETIDFDFAKEMNPFVINATQEIAK